MSWPTTPSKVQVTEMRPMSLLDRVKGLFGRQIDRYTETHFDALLDEAERSNDRDCLELLRQVHQQIVAEMYRKIESTNAPINVIYPSGNIRRVSRELFKRMIREGLI